MRRGRPTAIWHWRGHSIDRSRVVAMPSKFRRMEDACTGNATAETPRGFFVALPLLAGRVTNSGYDAAAAVIADFERSIRSRGLSSSRCFAEIVNQRFQFGAVSQPTGLHS